MNNSTLPEGNIPESDLKVGLIIHFDMDCFMLGDAYVVESITDNDVTCEMYHMGKKLRDRYKEQYNNEYPYDTLVTIKNQRFELNGILWERHWICGLKD